MKSDISDKKLASKGRARIEWAGSHMKVLELICHRFRKEKPLQGRRVSACLHVTSETANLMIALKAGGARVVLCASNPLSTQDDVAASLVQHYGIAVYARKGENRKTYYSHIRTALNHKPELTMDDGADLVSAIHREAGRHDHVIAGTEETTTGVIRLRSLEAQGKLLFPIVAVNDAETKHFFDNRYGTGQSTLDGIIRATNVLLSGTTIVVCGYGWCGRGVAMRARGMGAKVVVTEVNPLKALEAVMDGFEVLPMKEAVRRGDIYITVTGNTSVIRREHFLKMKNGAIVANSGHFDVELDTLGLKKLSRKVRLTRENVQEFTLSNKRRIYLLAEGRLVNLSAAEGHPAMVMDMSFANQALSLEWAVQFCDSLERKVYKVPEEIDQEIARLKLKSIGVSIDQLTPQQKAYLAAWEAGT